MKKIFYLIFTVFTFCLSTTKTFSQSSYKTAVGLGIDFGDGSTIVGPSIKHFFNQHSAVTAELLFGDHFGAVGAFYQYHRSFKEARELKWYFGIGPEIIFNERDGELALRPMAGLDYKIKTLPISLSFEWRPIITIDEHSEFAAARFGIGIKYAFR